MRKKKPTNESICLARSKYCKWRNACVQSWYCQRVSLGLQHWRAHIFVQLCKCICANVFVQLYKFICAVVQMYLCNCTNVLVQWYKCIFAIVFFQLCRVICATQWTLFEHMCMLALSTCSSSLSSARCTWPFAPKPLNLPLCELWKFWPSLKIY